MKTIQRIIIGLLMMSIWFILNCADVNEAKNIEKHYTPVKIKVLQEQPFNDYIKVTGTVKAVKEVKIIAEESGVLQKVVRDKGSFVKKGDTLAILKNEIVSAQYKQAAAMLKQAELDVKAKNTLFQKKAISEIDYLSSKYQYEATKASYELAKSRYEKLFLKATISGLVNERFQDVGSYVTPMAPTFEILDIRYMKIRAGIAERYMDEIKIGTPVEITFDAFPELKIETKVTYKSSKVDPLSRTFIIEAEFANPGLQLGSEIVANVKVLKNTYQNKIIIPQDVVVESEQGYFVFIEKNSVVHKVPVKVENIVENKLVISGLNPGDHLVVVGQRNIADQDTVTVIND